ncbi:hypothetical protein JCM21900_005428 [Sporobolomyces salmonicolor]
MSTDPRTWTSSPSDGVRIPSMSRLPPPVPFTGGSNGISRSSTPDIGPPPPPKPLSVADSPSASSPSSSYTSSSPPSAGLAPSKSWTRIAPQQHFVNGRGNVQLPGAPQKFIPAPSSSPTALGLPPLQQEGQQAYVRRSPSPSPSVGSVSGRGGSPDPNDGAGTMSFPSQFGVRQRVAIKQSSRPQQGGRPSGGLPGGRPGGDGGVSPQPGSLQPEEKGKMRSSIMQSPSAQSHLTNSSSSTASSPTSTVTPVLSPVTLPSPLPPPSSAPPPPPAPPATSILDRPRPKTPDPFGANSTFSSRSTHAYAPVVVSRRTGHGPRPSAASTLSASSDRDRDIEWTRTTSPAPSTTTSIMDRPRPKTPDPYSSLGGGREMSVSPAPSLSPTVSRSRVTTPTPMTSVLDRPRPKTPDSGAMFRFGDGAAGVGAARPRTPESGGVFRLGEPGGGAFDRRRPKTPDSSNVFAFSAPAVEADRGREEVRKPSIMDRPRPRTPDSQAWLDGVGRSSDRFGAGGDYSTVRAATLPLPPTSTEQPPVSDRRLYGSHQPIGSTSSGLSALHLRSQSPSLNSLHHDSSPSSRALSAFSPTTALPAPSPSAGRPSFDSTLPSTYISSTNPSIYAPPAAGSRFAPSEPPLLKLDLDFGSSFSNSDTMFGLSDLLNFGSPSTSPSTPTEATAPPPSSNENTATPSTQALAQDVTTPTPTTQRMDLSDATAVNGTGGRHTSRKDPPRVDLKLELELEMERAIALNRPLPGVSEPAHVRTLSARELEEQERKREREEEEETGGRTTPGSGNILGGTTVGKMMRRKQESISSFTTGSTSDAASVMTSSISGSPKPLKRRRRRSLASLLSLVSNKDKERDGRERQESEEHRQSRSRSHTPEPAGLMASSTATPSQLSLMSNGTPSTTHYPRSHSPTPLAWDPNFSLDKNLPPMPSNPAPSGDITPSASAHDSIGGVGALGRRLSRLRTRTSSSQSEQRQSPSRAQPSGFQVISGSTSRKPRDNQGSISSFASSHTRSSSRKESSEFGYSSSGSAAFSALPLSEPPPLHQVPARATPISPPSASVPFGRRLVQRITKASSSAARTGESAESSSTWTMPVWDHDQEPKRDDRRFPQPPRRASLSNLLDGGKSSGEGKVVLGMSLGEGRKSDDLLTRGLGGERELRKDWNVPAASASADGHGFDRGAPRGGRRSFDLLTERETIPRRPSTDNLLTLASAKLSRLAVSDETGDAGVSPVTPTAHTHSSRYHSADASSPTSGQSTPSFEAPDPASPIIATAAIVSRADSAPSMAMTDPDSPLFARTAAPMLVRSDSLRSTQKSTLTRAPSMTTGTGTASSTTGATPRTTQSNAAWRKQRGKVPDSGVGSDASMSSAWLDLEDALGLYSKAVRENQLDRSAIVTTTLLPFLKREEDNPAPRVNETLAKRQREVLFGWLATLTTELREMQPAHRGACLEAVAAIAESHFLSATILQDDVLGQARYRTAVVKVLDFAVEKLNDKAVYANTLVFSGRVFALAFFRIEGVALKLLRALPPVKCSGLRRILEEAGVKEHELPPVNLEAFPSHLWSLCLRDFRTYTALLMPLTAKPKTGDEHYLVRDGDIVVEMSGNWLIRWTASDSDLPFAFYRAYHRQLAAHLIPSEVREDIAGEPPLAPSAVITSPGFLFLAASLLDKSDALVHRNLRSVTSIGPNSSNFNTNDSANLSFGQKPKVLELAHRRLVQTMLDIVGGPPTTPGDGVDVAPDAEPRRYAFSRMLQVWIRACVKRTSMWDTRSVFILLDLIEGLIYTLSYPTPSAKGSAEEDALVPKPDERCLEMFDFPFIFSVIKKVLLEADNTVAIMRTISFIYAHFEIFTMRPRDRTELCEKVILDEKVFSRLFLHYNTGCRGFMIRLLVWRLSRLGVVAKEQNPNLPPDEGILALFGLLNVRLEALRKRHDQLEPLDDLTDEEDIFRPKRSTICSTRGVKEAPWTVDELAEAVEEEDSDIDEEPQELMRSIPPPSSSTSSIGEGSTKKGDLKTVAKVVSWLRGGLGKKQKGAKVIPLPPAKIDPFTVERSATVRRPTQEAQEPFIEDGASAASSQELAAPSLPTTIETGVVPSKETPKPVTPTGPVVPHQPSHLSPTPLRTKSSSRPDRRSSRPTSPAFFSFEFENGVVSRSDVDPTVASSASALSSASSTGTADTVFPSSPIRRTANANVDPQSAISPRVSLRFSKRISILPPAALDLLKQEGVAPVPPIPDQYRMSMQQGYDKKLHPYAVRGLRDYEDALDEWTDWVARLQEEEDMGGKVNSRSFVDVVPRLAVSWPTSFLED